MAWQQPTTPARACVVVAEDVGKEYRRGWALRECRLVIPQDRVVALVGPNGAGKSTMMGLITGLLQPTAGAITVLGERPGGGRMHPGVAYLAQQKPLYPRLSVAETLLLGSKTNSVWDHAYATSLVEQAGVPLAAKVRTLSGGQRTRVALALALGKRPQLLLLDEPLADLDPLAREQVLATLSVESRRNGMTVLLSSHVLTELENVCNHLVLMHRGRVLLAGDVDHLITRNPDATTLNALAMSYLRNATGMVAS